MSWGTSSNSSQSIPVCFITSTHISGMPSRQVIPIQVKKVMSSLRLYGMACYLILLVIVLTCLFIWIATYLFKNSCHGKLHQTYNQMNLLPYQHTFHPSLSVYKGKCISVAILDSLTNRSWNFSIMCNSTCFFHISYPLCFWSMILSLQEWFPTALSNLATSTCIIVVHLLLECFHSIKYFWMSVPWISLLIICSKVHWTTTAVSSTLLGIK